ncbi:MAG: DivIVA domain-containing protein [Syntrophomonadaceae bacterium]|nr:DivIVA domain-containing protein [Syntrophomonadaceae bacterium]MDD3888985.1 DivIVA domain-containing protein [Syntrophomonadaceae bacterium]MDD4549722.1 DivIVA domain-containing protein [Syntrophomonadaceae bacterium]
MITPMEIRNQQFNKSVRGYKEIEVKSFLSQMAMDYENLYSENAKLKENIQRLEYELDKYHKLEETMNNSLILAQQTAEEVKTNARKEAELFMQQAKKRITDILMIYQEIIKRMGVFSAELKGQLTGELEMLEKNQGKIDELSNFFYSSDLKQLVEQLEKITLEEG